MPAIPAAHPAGDPARDTCTGRVRPARPRLPRRHHRPGADRRLVGPPPALQRRDRNRGAGPRRARHRRPRGRQRVRGASTGSSAPGSPAARWRSSRTPSTGFHMYYQRHGPGQRQRPHAAHRLPRQGRLRGRPAVVDPSRRLRGRPARHERDRRRSTGARSTRSWSPRRCADSASWPPSSPAPAPAGAGDEGRVGRVASFVAAGVPNDRNFRVFYAAKQLALPASWTRARSESLVGAALQAGLRGGEREARRSIASGSA